MWEYDNLGPLSREVVRNCPSELIVGRMRASLPLELYSDHPATMDANLALWLRAQIKQRYKAPAESFVLTGRKRQWLSQR